MTLQDIKDAFEADYKLGLAIRRDSKEINFGAKMVYRLITKAQAEIQRKLMPTEGSSDITLVSGTAEYDLPSSVGVHKDVKSTINNSIAWLKEKSISDLNKLYESSDTGNCSFYAIYSPNGTQKIKVYPKPGSAGTLTVSYYKKLLNYSSADTVDLTQTFGLPDEYAEGVILYMLNEVFGDDLSYAKYNEKMKSLLGSRNVSIDTSLTYNIAGLD